MMNLKTLFSPSLILGVFLGLFALQACKQDEALQGGKSTEPQELRGAIVSLSLEGETGLMGLNGVAEEDIATDNFKAMTYKLDPEKNGFPRLELPAVGTKMSVLCIFRKLGDASTTTYSQLEWTIKEREDKSKYLSYTGPVQLASGDFLKSDAGKWYMMAVIGGTAEHLEGDYGQARIRIDAQTLYEANDEGKLVADIPYIMPWTPLTIAQSDGYAEHKSLRFRPQGSLLRVSVRNGMVADYQLKKLKVAANTFVNAAYLDLSKTKITDEMLTATTQEPKPDGSIRTFAGKLPQWVETQPLKMHEHPSAPALFGSEDKGIWSVDLWGDYNAVASQAEGAIYYATYNYPSNLTIASGTESKAFYAWVLPTNIEASQAKAQFYVEAASSENPDMLYGAIPVHKTNAKLLSGAYYYAYPELTSDLIINKVLVNIVGTESSGTGFRSLHNGAKLSYRLMERLRSSDDDDDDWEDEDAPVHYPPETEGAIPVFFEPNLSTIELYNPTLDTIDLRQYGILRTVWKDDLKVDRDDALFYKYNAQIGASPSSVAEATVLPFEAFVTPSDPFAASFSSWSGDRGSHDYAANYTYADNTPVKRLNLIGTSPEPMIEDGQFKLLPGRAILLGASGFRLRDNDTDYKEAREAVVAKINEAIAHGYCQYALTYNDGNELNAVEWGKDPYTNYSNTLAIANAIGVVLVKKLKTDGFRVVDTSIPYRDAYAGLSSMYITDWDAFINEYTTKGSDGVKKIQVQSPKGYVRVQGTNHAHIRPLYYPRGHYYQFHERWTFLEPNAYTYKPQGTTQFVKPPLRFWPKK